MIHSFIRAKIIYFGFLTPYCWGLLLIFVLAVLFSNYFFN